MTEINLLPWRDTLRHAIKREFLIVMTIILVLAISILIIGVNVIKVKMQRQLKVNIALQTRIDLLELKFSAIKTIQSELHSLAAKQDALEKWQSERMLMVRLLEQVVYQTPSGVYLTRFDKKGMGLTFEGVAESNVRVSEFMQKIGRSQWIVEPNLMEIKVSSDKENSNGYYFKITARCSSLRASEYREQGVAIQEKYRMKQ
jgi:type IV pilus assembly protein PilN